jgi:hypothetical protein
MTVLSMADWEARWSEGDMIDSEALWAAKQK